MTITMDAETRSQGTTNKDKTTNDENNIEPPASGSHWRIWSCIGALTKDTGSNPMLVQPYRSTTLQVAAILEQWGNNWAGDLEWASFLNKRTLHHEAEESIVALYHLREWMTRTKEPQKFIALDVCGGKGFFSMLLSYVASDFWQPRQLENTTTEDRQLDSIILLEKCKTSDIDWNHIHAANAREKSHPEIVIWSDTNLHEYDVVISKLRSLCLEKKTTLALTGIHLCKMLSPSLVSLANGLGCPYLCLAPCCLPRVVLNKAALKKNKDATIPIYLHETPYEQQDRLEHNRRKLIARNNHACFYCQKKRHWVKQCPDLKVLSKEEQDKIVDDAIQNTPCWNCGTIGHFRQDCPTPSAKITTKYPPSLEMNVSNVIKSSTPFEDYCTLLAGYIQLDGSAAAAMCHPVMEKVKPPSSSSQEPRVVKKLKSSSGVQIIEAGLTGNKSGHDGNWNSRRKSIFLVASSH